MRASNLSSQNQKYSLVVTGCIHAVTEAELSARSFALKTPAPSTTKTSHQAGCISVDFEGGDASGWTNDPMSTCLTGGFVVGIPNEVVDSGTMTQVHGDHTTGTGNAFFSGINTSAGTHDVDSGVCIISSPTYSVSEESSVSIWYFHGQRDAGDDPTGDFFSLKMSINGGITWSVLAENGDKTSNAAWLEATDTVQAGSKVQFMVEISDGTGPGDLIEAGIDDLLICPIYQSKSSQKNNEEN